MLVQVWCEQQTKLESTDPKNVGGNCKCSQRKQSNHQRPMPEKIKYLKTHYKMAKDANRNQTGGERNTSPYYDEIDSILGCRDIVHFHNVEEAGATSRPSTAQQTGQEDDNHAIASTCRESSSNIRKRSAEKTKRDDKKRAAKRQKKSNDDEEEQIASVFSRDDGKLTS